MFELLSGRHVAGRVVLAGLQRAWGPDKGISAHAVGATTGVPDMEYLICGSPKAEPVQLYRERTGGLLRHRSDLAVSTESTQKSATAEQPTVRCRRGSCHGAPDSELHALLPS